MKKFLLSLTALAATATLTAQPRTMSLNGDWDTGTDRRYTSTARVPDVGPEPDKKNAGRIWYRREVTLPKGNWTQATLCLMGARFQPEVYVNGVKVSSAEGGMAPTYHTLAGAAVKPGKKITLEISLASLADVPPADASYIPVADQWRSHNSSELWDDVILTFHRSAKVGEVVLFPDIAAGKVRIDYGVEYLAKNARPQKGTLTIRTTGGKELMKKPVQCAPGRNSVTVEYKGVLREWSPEDPALYRLEIDLEGGDGHSMPFGIKEFAVKGRHFTFNGKPCALRGSTVVWHRWVRNPEGAALGYDTTWFRDNIVQRLKDHGANYLRFHLGVPPRRILELCDRYGLISQYEWSFFHGMPATEESCREQYGHWLAASTPHPSIAVFHPYNETEGEALKWVWSALDAHLPKYPQLVISERDVMHLHKYWWSIFENVGLFYDSHEEFPWPVIVDEFGGNYLDGYGEPGGYVTLKESFLRFAGRKQTPEARLKLQDYSHGRIAEYWRRLNVAGIAPFPIASSWEDGNHWFLGPLAEGRPKAVWNSLTAAWSPVTVSAEIWDRNFTPGQSFTFPLWFINDTDKETTLRVRVSVEDASSKIWSEEFVEKTLGAFSRTSAPHTIVIPSHNGDYIIKAELLNRPAQVKYPVVSKWDVRCTTPVVTPAVKALKIYVPADEKELAAFVRENGLQAVSSLTEADHMLLSRTSWDRLASGGSTLSQTLKEAINAGVSVIMLDAGNINLGHGYPDEQGQRLSPEQGLQGLIKVENPKVKEYELFSGVKLVFTQTAEPESFLFPSPESERLWQHMPAGYTGMWNGLRGGLMVPAYDMSVTGLNEKSFLEGWASRGGDRGAITGDGDYYAYELHGFYAFSTRKDDKQIREQLKERVRFLIEDAPALAVVMNTTAPVTVTNLAAGYREARSGVAEGMQVLANAGKNLTRTPVIEVDFGQGKGRLIVSQLLTRGRLAHGFGEDGLYGIRYDAAAVQTVLNMIE